MSGPLAPAPAPRARTRTIVGLMAAVVLCDQLAKLAARAHLQAGHPVRLLGGTLKLTLIRNGGAFLGLGAGLPDRTRFLIFTLGGAAVILAGVAYLMWGRGLNRRLDMLGALVMGGAIGNQIDRFLFHGAVTDFFLLQAGPLHTGIFNVADMAITFGAIIMLLEPWREFRAASARSRSRG